MDWTDEKLVFTVDSVVHFVYNPPIKNAQTWPFDANHYILLNVAMEGNTDPNFLVDSMNIDYIRIYQQQPTTFSIPEDSEDEIQSYPNPFTDHIVLDKIGSDAKSVEINMYHINGQRIEKFTQRQDGDKLLIEGLGYLPKGIYLLECNQNGESHTLKLIKE